ncbi:MAG: 4-hydroxy-tetrahydrodipicolinate synthase, partial [Actinomycetota bacterium]
GSDGLVVCGTTGESPTLTHDEKLGLFEAVSAEVGGRAKVIAGTGTNNTAESITLTREAADIGVDACLIVTPYYNKPPQNAILAHFFAIADESPVPLIAYDVPPRTSKRIERATMVKLAEHERIVADKDAVGDALETAKLRADLDRAGHHDFELYSGDDVMLMPHLAAGVVGVISVCSHIVGDRLKLLMGAWNDGKIEEAKGIYHDLLPLMSTIMGLTTSPIPVKAAVNLIGLDVGEPRLPLVPPTADEAAKIRAALEAANLL